MWSIGIVFLEPDGKPFPQFIVVNRSSLHPKEKLFFIRAEGSFNERILIGTTLVNAMMRKLELRTECVKSSLEFEAIVCLDEEGFEGKPREHHDEGTDTPILIQLIKDDGFLVAGVNINDGIFVTGPGKARKFRSDVFDIHLEVANSMDVLGMHMDRWLIPWAHVIAPSVHQPFSFQNPVNGRY